jgi:hypothetical protein
MGLGGSESLDENSRSASAKKERQCSVADRGYRQASFMLRAC